MLLHADPSLAEVPGFSREQLDALARNVELRRQQLEDDIHDYIRRQQDELHRYEHEQLAHHRSMERSENPESTQQNSNSSNADAVMVASPSASAVQSAQLSPNARTREPEEKLKRTKHTRVQKREKELYGLVTPVFLPLLDARAPSPKHEKTQPMDGHVGEAHVTSESGVEQVGPAKTADKSCKETRKARSEHKDMDGLTHEDSAKENQSVDSLKKSRRSAIKKSALKQHNTSRSRRKRVSLVIDGQTVLPADTVIEPPPTSPSETTSASNSTTSLDDMIDPRLTRHDTPNTQTRTHTEHYDAVHHSLPRPMSHNDYAPSKPIIDTPTDLSTHTSPTVRSPPSPSVQQQQPSSYLYNPPSTALHTFLDNPSSIPAFAGSDPIFADDLDSTEEGEESFSTYVGGLHGSGTDDVDQAGSYGYPSSLGASYLESYMQNRPLRVRMDAADKAGLSEGEKRVMMGNGDNKNGEDDEDEGLEIDMDKGKWGGNGHALGHGHEDDEMDIVGSMEDF